MLKLNELHFKKIKIAYQNCISFHFQLILEASGFLTASVTAGYRYKDLSTNIKSFEQKLSLNCVLAIFIIPSKLNEFLGGAPTFKNSFLRPYICLFVR